METVVGGEQGDTVKKGSAEGGALGMDTEMRAAEGEEPWRGAPQGEKPPMC